MSTGLSRGLVLFGRGSRPDEQALGGLLADRALAAVHPDGELARGRLGGTQLDLRPGDTLLFASDGILESENSQEEEFGLQRLSAVLTSISPLQSASEICEIILNATDEYSGGGFTPSDDRTLLVLRVTDHTSGDFSKLPIIY